MQSLKFCQADFSALQLSASSMQVEAECSLRSLLQQSHVQERTFVKKARLTLTQGTIELEQHAKGVLTVRIEPRKWNCHGPCRSACEVAPEVCVMHMRPVFQQNQALMSSEMSLLCDAVMIR